MTEILDTVIRISTPLALLGLVVALGYFAYGRLLKHQETQLEALPPEQRATAIDEYLTRYGIDGKNLRIQDKVALIKNEMEQRHNRARLYVVLAAIVFVVCFAIAAIAYSLQQRGGEDQDRKLTELRESISALVKDTESMRKRIEAYEAKNHLNNDPPPPNNQFVLALLELAKALGQVQGELEEYEARHGPVAGAKEAVREAQQVVRQGSALGTPMIVVPARIATNHLTPRAYKGAQQLLANRPLYDSSVVGWAYELRRKPTLTAKYPSSTQWHFVNIPVGDQRFVLARDCPQGKCLVTVIPRFQKVLKDDKASTEDRSEALMFLIRLVPELHQPLHCALRNNDSWGSKVKVSLPTNSKLNLHRVWDTFLLQQRLGNTNPLDYADRLNGLNGNTTAHDRDKWVRGSLEDWAWESHQLAVRYAYKGIPVDGPPFKLGTHYIRQNALIMERQMMKAGVRLSYLINECFEG
jgi:hypothetical protein